MAYRIIELTADVKNPSVDRRSKDWHKMPTIIAGSRFIVGGNSESIRMSGERHGWEYCQTELGKLVMANSKPVEPESFRELACVADCDWGADEILRILVKLGKVGAADFAAVAACPEDF